MFPAKRFVTHIAPVALALLVLGGCGGTTALVSSQLDPLTGVTVTSAATPIVFYRDRSAQAAHARDYVYLGPIEVNNMGQRNYYLWLGIWGTSDSTDRSSQLDNFESIVVFADGEPLSLDVKGWTPESIGISEPAYVKPVASAMDGYYRVTIDQIRLMAEAHDLEVRAGSARPQRYTPWNSAATPSGSIRAFVKQVL